MSTNDPQSGPGGEFLKHVDTATDAAQGFNPPEYDVDKQFSYQHKNQDAPTDTIGGQPPTDPGSAVSGGQPHMNPGASVDGWPLSLGSTTHVMLHDADKLNHTFDEPGTDAEGGQPHMDGGAQQAIDFRMNPGATVEGGQPHMDGGAEQAIDFRMNPDGTPSWSAPGNPDHSIGSVAPGPPDRSFGGVVIVGLILLLLLVGAGGGFIALKQGVFGCQGSYYHGRDVTATLLTSCNAGKTSGGQRVVGTNPTVAVAPTISAAAPTATPAPQPSPTATPKPRPPTPTVKITSPANNYMAATSYDTPPIPPTITFKASATAGSGASSVTVTWVDSIDGTLGTGATLSHTLRSNPSTPCNGRTKHVITAKVKNNLGGTASASITVNVIHSCHI